MECETYNYAFGGTLISFSSIIFHVFQVAKEKSCWDFKNIGFHGTREISRRVLLMRRSREEDKERELRYTDGRHVINPGGLGTGSMKKTQQGYGGERDSVGVALRKFATEQHVLLPVVIFLPCFLMAFYIVFVENRPLYGYARYT